MFKGLLNLVEKIESGVDSVEDPDELRLLQIRLAMTYDKVTEAARATRTCPGPYWRNEEEEGQPKKRRLRRRRHNKDHCSGNTFSKLYLGPPRVSDETDTRQVLCDACGQIWARDKKRKGLK
jgi:hypothetical protein